MAALVVDSHDDKAEFTNICNPMTTEATATPESTGTGWATKMLAAEYDYMSPSGSCEIRLFPSFEQGEIVHARALPGKPSKPAILTGCGEFFYILDGEGELWRNSGAIADLTRLVPQRCAELPPGISYQYRAIGGPMEFLVCTAPRWRRENWAEAQTRCWADDGRLLSKANWQPGPWATIDLSANHDDIAPDGSEIRLLLSYDAGGLAHCRLPAGCASAAVKHRTIVEIWYVVSGHGEVWRGNGELEEVVEVAAGTALTIPVGTSFQFRAAPEAPLDIILGTFPRWPGADEAVEVPGRWTSHLQNSRP
jgi:mannose-6-phosphate isomerase-like protein (cupin superfamily)